MLYRVKQIISRFKNGRVMSVYSDRHLKWKSQKLPKKILILSSFVLVLAAGVVGYSFFNTAKADNGYETIIWSSQADFETNPAAANVGNGQTERTNIDTTSSPGDIKISAGQTSGNIKLKVNAGDGNVYGATGWQATISANMDLPYNACFNFSFRQASSDSGLDSADWMSPYGWCNLWNEEGFVNYQFDWSLAYDIGLLSSGQQWTEININLDQSSAASSPAIHSISTNFQTDFTPPTITSIAAYTDSSHNTEIPSEMAGYPLMPTAYSNSSLPSFQSHFSDGQLGSGVGFAEVVLRDSYGNWGSYSGSYGDLNDLDICALNDMWGYCNYSSGQGEYYLDVLTLSDVVGNSTYLGYVFRYIYDVEAPSTPTSLSISPSVWTSVNDFSVTMGASIDNYSLAGYQYKIDNASAWSDIITESSFKLPSSIVVDGVHTLYVRAIDKAGNTSAVVNEAFTYISSSPDAPLPPLTPAVPVDQAISTENSFDFRWKAPSYDGIIKGYKYSVTGTDNSGNPIRPASSNNDDNTTFISAGSAISTTDNITNSSSDSPGLYYNADSGVYTLHKVVKAAYQGVNMFYLVAVGSSTEKDMVTYDDVHTLAVSKSIDQGYSFSFVTDAPSPPSDLQLFDVSDRGVTPTQYKVALKWTAVNDLYKKSDFTGYSIQRADCVLLDDQQTPGIFSEIGFSTNASFIDDGDAGVNPLSSSCYYYQVLSKNESGALSWDPEKPDSSFDPSLTNTIKYITPTGRYWEPATITSSPEITVTPTVTKALVQWSTNRNSSSLVEFGTDPITASCDKSYGSIQGQIDELTQSHSVTVIGLKPDTTYHYRAKFIDQDGNVGCSTNQSATFQTKPAPRIENVAIQDVRLYTALLTWYTSEPAQADLLYGTSSDYSDTISNVSGGNATIHSIRLDKLQDSTTYNFAIRIRDIDGNAITSDNYTFETLKYPRISNVQFQPLSDQATAAFQVSWDTNVPTSSVVQYKPDGGTVQESVKTKLETKHTITLNGLFDNTYYLMNALGIDQFGNTATSDSQRIKTAYDTRPPAIDGVTTEVSNTEFGSAAKSQIVVSWQTDEPGTSQVEYDFGVTGEGYGSKTQEDANLTTSHVVVLTELRPSSAYHLRAVSRDASGNKGVSEQQSVLTEQARSSVLDVILNSLQSSLGWIFGMR